MENNHPKSACCNAEIKHYEGCLVTDCNCVDPSFICTACNKHTTPAVREEEKCSSCEKYEPMNTKCILHRPPAPQSWEERFRTWFDQESGWHGITRDQLQSFIAAEIEKAKEEAGKIAYEQGRAQHKYDCRNEFAIIEALANLRAELKEKLPLFRAGEYYEWETEEWRKGYNEAAKEARSLLDNTK